MRRPAPDIHPRKQQRLDDTPGYSFKELGRFDYRAADAIADGSQGFIITCDFRRCLFPPLCAAFFLTYSCKILFEDLMQSCFGQTGSDTFSVQSASRREKSATREAMEALRSCAREIAPDAPDVAFSIIKLPCRGVVLLRWQPSSADGGEDRPPLPPPAHVVAALIRRITDGKSARLT